MARTFVRAESDYLEAASVAISAGPITVSAWYRPSSITGGSALGLGRSSTNSDYRALFMNAGGQTGYEVNGPGGTHTALVAGAMAANVWTHMAAVEASVTSRTAYRDGTASTVSTGNVGAISAPDRTTVGALRLNGALASIAGGDIAEVAIWNIALTSTDITALAGGANPLTIEAGNLVFYAPIHGDDSPETDVTVGARHLTVNGAVDTVEHPPVDPPPGGTNAEVTAVPAAATGAVPVPTVSGSATGEVTAVPVDGAGDVPAPSVSAGADVVVPPAGATGSLPLAGNEISSEVAAPPAQATGDLPAPTVTTESGATVTAVPADGTGDLPAPTASAGASVAASPADGAGDLVAPSVSGGLAPVPTVALGTHRSATFTVAGARTVTFTTTGTRRATITQPSPTTADFAEAGRTATITDPGQRVAVITAPTRTAIIAEEH